MSLDVSFKAVMGNVYLTQEHDGKKNKFVIDICQANATCAFIHKRTDENGEVWNDFVMFFNDRKHINNLIKNKVEVFYGKITKVQLNMWYKESADVLKYFVRMGHKVECYYKQPK